MKIEYRVMFNAYDGQGNQFYKNASSLFEAIEIKSKLRNLYKGVAWIESREVTEWKKITIK